MKITILAIALASSAVGSDLIDCYGRNDRKYANNTRCPGSNACCGPEATCLSNRLCHNPNDGPGTYVRGPCAIFPYDSGTCAQVCLYDEERGIFPRVTACADGSFCCDNDAQCCDNNRGVFLGERGLIAESAPASYRSFGPERTATTYDLSPSEPTQPVMEPTKPAAESTSATPTPTPTSAPEENGSSANKALAIGLGVAVPIVCVAAAIALFFFFWRRRKAHRETTVTEMPAGKDGELQQKPVPDGNNGGFYAPQELDADNGAQYNSNHKYR